jgi:uncharacterized damage-inducible protein DinB
MHALFLSFSVNKLQQLTGRIETCLDRLTPEQIWWREEEAQNAVGNLVLHLCGNLGQWILTGIGGEPDTRQRDAEFSARGGPDAEELKRRLRERLSAVARVIETIPENRMTERIRVQSYDTTVLEAVYHVVEHFAMHTGQILYATKLLTKADLGFYRHLSAATHTEKTP